jgi:hypothetical protein
LRAAAASSIPLAISARKGVGETTLEDDHRSKSPNNFVVTAFEMGGACAGGCHLQFDKLEQKMPSRLVDKGTRGAFESNYRELAMNDTSVNSTLPY